MALPQVKERDIVEVKLHNHDKMYLSHGDLYTSKKRNGDSQVTKEDIPLVAVGGKARVTESDRDSITLTDVNGEYSDPLRVERYFIKEMNLLERQKIVSLGDDSGYEALLPSSDKGNLGIAEEGTSYNDEEYTPASVRKFLKKFKALYLTKKPKKKKKKAKKKKAKKLKSYDKGTKITKTKWVSSMVVDLEAIDWDDTGNGLNSLELWLVFKGKLRGVLIGAWEDGFISVKLSTSTEWVAIDLGLVKSITLAKDYKDPEPVVPVKYEDPYDVEFEDKYGKDLGSLKIGYQSISFWEKRIEVGCQEFEVADFKKLYKELCKVYGTPE